MRALRLWRAAFLGLGAAVALQACLLEDPGFRVIVPAGTRTSFTPDSFPARASASPAAQASPQGQGQHFATGRPLDVAISGVGHFVLSGEGPVQDLAQLSFTRLGAFAWQSFPAQGDRPAGARLVDEAGRRVWGVSWDASGRLPEEGQGSSFDLAFRLGGQRPGPIELFAAPTLNLASLRLGADGQVQDPQGGELFDAEGRALRWALILARAERPEAMQGLGGGVFRPTRESGPFQVGLAGSPRLSGGLARPVGDGATLRPGHLEAVGN